MTTRSEIDRGLLEAEAKRPPPKTDAEAAERWWLLVAQQMVRV